MDSEVTEDGRMDGRAAESKALDDHVPHPQSGSSATLPPPIRAPGSGVLARPFAAARCLAGFMQPTSVLRHVPYVHSLPASVVQQIEERFGRSSELAVTPGAGKPQFMAVREPSVLRMLELVARESPMPPSLNNLIGFEWVEIAPMVAGRLEAQEPWAESMPLTWDLDAVARFCTRTCVNLPDLLPSQPGQLPQVAFPVDMTLSLNGPVWQVREADGLTQVLLNVQYVFTPTINPIRVLVVEGRTVALTGLGRLVALLSQGVSKALCSVSYGYGEDAILAAPTTEPELLCAGRPPLIGDFLNPDLTVGIPTRNNRVTFHADLRKAKSSSSSSDATSRAPVVRMIRSRGALRRPRPRASVGSRRTRRSCGNSELAD